MNPCALLLVVAGVSVAAAADEGYRFAWEGKEFTPSIVVVTGDSGRPAAGDVIRVNGFTLVLDGPGTYAFRLDSKNRLMSRLPGSAAEACVGVLVSSTLEDDAWTLIDPLSDMPAKDKAMLRSVVMNGRPKDTAKAFAGIAWSHTLLTLGDKFAEEENREVLPPLPEGLRYLSLDFSTTPSITRVDALYPLRALVYLKLERGVEVDLSKLTCGGMLRYFATNGATLKQPDAIGSWAGLRNLSLAYGDVKDIGYAANLHQLQVLDLRRSDVADVSAIEKLGDLRVLSIESSGVRDLSPIARLPKLQTVLANASRVTTLPATIPPSLTKLSLIGTPVDNAAVTALRQQAPKCTVLHGWREALVTSLAGTDRLRFRTGGTCHRNPTREETIFEVKDHEELAGIIGSLDFDEKNSGGVCMCCGDSTLEFYQGGTLLASLGFHHGHSLRWSDGEWPGDATLAPAAGESLCRLMDKHGHAQPLKELLESRERDKAWRRYAAACESLLPLAQCEAWCKGENGDGKAVIADADKTWHDAAERTARVISLYGVLPASTWRNLCGLDGSLKKHLLPRVTQADINGLLEHDKLPEQTLQGAARRLLFDSEGAELLRGLPDRSLAMLSTWALRHPRADNRVEALQALAGLRQPRADALLLDYLESRPDPRRLAPEDEAEPGGQVLYQPGGFKLSEGLTDRQAAAHLLALRGTAKALPVIERLAVEAPEAERPAYAKAAELLRQSAK